MSDGGKNHEVLTQSPAVDNPSVSSPARRRALLGGLASVAAVGLNLLTGSRKAEAQGGSLKPLPTGETPKPADKKPEKPKKAPLAINTDPPEMFIGIEDIPNEIRKEIVKQSEFAHNYIAVKSPPVKVEERMGEETIVVGVNVNKYKDSNIDWVNASLEVYYSNTEPSTWKNVPDLAEIAALKIINRGNDEYPAQQLARVYQEFKGVSIEDDEGSKISELLNTPEDSPQAMREAKNMAGKNSLIKTGQEALKEQIGKVQENKYIKAFRILKNDSDMLVHEISSMPPAEAEAAANIFLAPLKYTLQLGKKYTSLKDMGFNEENVGKLIQIGRNKINLLLPDAA